MRRRAGEAKPLFWVWVGFGSLAAACGGGEHSCIDTRSCIAPVGFVDAGNSGDWWDGGASGSDPATDGAGTGGFGASTDGAGAGAAGMAEAGAAGDDARDSFLTGPHVAALSPADHAVGVEQDAAIRITFDRAMNEATVLTAYASDDLPLSALNASWNSTRTTLTLTPKAQLSYASGSVAVGTTPDFSAKRYRFSLTERAVDDAGRALEPASFSFSTLRAVSSELAADPTRTGNWTEGEGEGVHNCLRQPPRGYVPTVCIGDDSSNVRYTGFITFDLNALPAGVRAFTSARLVAGGSVNGTLSPLGATSLEHITFAELDAAALTAPSSASLGSFLSAAPLRAGSTVELSLDVTAPVALDYARGGSQLSQYRLAFAAVAANGIWDDLELPTNQVSLALDYLLP